MERPGADLDDQSGYTEPYDSCSEPRPDHIVYHQQFKDLRKLSNEAIELLAEPLENSSYHNAITNGLRQEIRSRTKNDTFDEVQFAVAGDMAAGKSSVINSILSCGGTIARKGDSGGSCTWVVQRFMKEFPAQSSPFEAHVYFFNDEDIVSILRSLLQKYWEAAGLRKDNTDDDGDDENDDQVQNFNEMRTTLDTLMALFSGREGFETEESARAFLKEAQRDEDEESLGYLTATAGDIVSEHLNGNEFVTVNGSTPDDLLFHLQPFTYTVGGEDSHGIATPWPLVSVIDFGLNVPLLNEGIIFVDSPGLSDANSARAENAMRYHMQCTHKISVAEISRAKDNKALRENLALGYKTRGSGNTILVLTRGDSIDPSTEVNGHQAEMKKERKLHDQIRSLGQEKQRLNSQRTRLKFDERFEVDSKMQEIGKMTRRVMKEHSSLRSTMRNRSVIQAVQKHYKELTNDSHPLAAFAVGNEDYQNHLAGFDDHERPAMSVCQTGIPALRQCIFLLPARGKLNNSVHLATAQLPSLIHSVELFCGKTHMARRSEIEAIVVRPKEWIKANTVFTTEKLRTEIYNLFLNPIRAEEVTWSQQSRVLCRVWTARHSKDHLYMLKKSGYKQGTRRAPTAIDWNAELVELQEELYDKAFKDLSAAFDKHEESLRKSFGSVLDRTRKQIRDDPQFNIMALEPFLKSFIIEKPIAIKRITATFREMRTEVGNLHRRLLTSSADSFTTKAMNPVYAEVRLIKGKGGPAMRLKVLEDRVCKLGGIFIRIHDMVEAALDALLNKHLAALEQCLTKIIDDIHQKFTMMCEDTEVKTEEEKEQEEKLREHLQKNLIKAKELVDGPIQSLAIECKEYTPSSY